MAEIAFAVIAKVLDKLGSFAYQEFGPLWRVKSELKKLEGTISIISEVLLDAGKKQASNPLLRIWIEQLNDVLHDAEDVLDEIEYEALRKQAFANYGSTSIKVRHFFSSSMLPAFPFKLAHRMRAIREQLGVIAAAKDQFNLTIIPGYAHITRRLRDTDSISFVHPPTIIGRDKAKETIINLLMQPDDRKNVSVISIVGLGGLGKTTLARWVYNDGHVVETFQLRMWVCVSEDFSFTRLIKEILKAAYGTIDPYMTIDVVQTKLREVISHRKFLLVLDDVWNEDRYKWLELRDLLVCGSKGSKIIVTARSQLVASIMSTDSTYCLEGLSQKDCLSLFVKCAFKEGEEEQYPNLLEFGKEIVRKCQGVPLAVRALGSLLYSKVDESEWEFVRDNEIWKLEQREYDVLSALRLSYDQLPIYLKRCFAFCSVFPKDYEFKSYLLIQSWMAHGLILEASINEKQELEDVGNMYINELFSRSFFQDVEKEHPFYPYVYTFKMHDVIHDLAIAVSRTVRHLSFSEMDQEIPKLRDGTKVRTIMFTTKPLMSLLAACILRFEYLRLLDLSDSSFEVLPSSLGTLKHLRYLDLSRNERIKKLSNSTCKLYNLQTLLLEGCARLERLPKDTRTLIRLRCLFVTTTYMCLLENGALNSLRCLGLVSCPRLEVLFQGMDGCLTNLRSLMIYWCPSLTTLSLNLNHLNALEDLVIYGCPELRLMEGENNQDLKLSLRSLEIGYLPKLEVLPIWIQGSANTLQVLRITDCWNFKALSEWLPTLNSLNTLEIVNCPKLSSLPEGIDRLTALRKLKIRGCPELVRKCQHEDMPKIAHVPEVKLDEDQSASTDEDVEVQHRRKNIRQAQILAT